MLQQEDETDYGQTKKVSACYCDGSALALTLTVCIHGRSASPENSGNQGGDTLTKGVPMPSRMLILTRASLHIK